MTTKKKIVIERITIKRMMAEGLRAPQMAKILGCTIKDIQVQHPGLIINNGRPKRQPTKKEIANIEKWAEDGGTAEDMRYMLGISNDLWVRWSKDFNFSEIIKKGHGTLRMSLRSWQVRAARDCESKSQVTMLVWLGKNILNQTDKGLTQDDTGETPGFDARRILETCEG